MGILMHHPQAPRDREVHVSAVGRMEAQGWSIVGEDPPAPEPKPKRRRKRSTAPKSATPPDPPAPAEGNEPDPQGS